MNSFERGVFIIFVLADVNEVELDNLKYIILVFIVVVWCAIVMCCIIVVRVQKHC